MKIGAHICNAIAQGWAITHSLFAHFLSFQKSDCAIARSFALWKRANERSLLLSLFAKKQKSDRSFFDLSKIAWKWAKNERFSKSHIFRSKKRPIAHYQYEQILGNRSLAHLLNLSSLIFKRAFVQLLAKSLFKKERMSDCSFCRSLQKSDCQSWFVLILITFLQWNGLKKYFNFK